MKKRLIVCFDVIGGNVTKAKKFQDNIYVAPAAEMAKRMAEEGIDEVIFFDVTASAERRMIDLDTVRAVKEHTTVPFIVGGGLRNLDDMKAAIEAGADKVSVDSMAVRNPDINIVYQLQKAVTPNFSQVCVGLFTGQLTGVKQQLKKLNDAMSKAREDAIAAAKKQGASVSLDDFAFSDFDADKPYSKLYKKA